MKIATHCVKSFCLAAVILAVPGSAFGIFADIGEDVPVDRLIENLEKYTRDHPKDAHGFYVLGRVHAMAFARDVKTVRFVQPDWERPLDQEGNPVTFSPFDRVQVKTSRPADPLPDAVRRHLVRSILNYEKAVQLDDKAAKKEETFHDRRFYRLGLGWMLETGATWVDQVGAPPTSRKLDPPEEALRERLRALLEQASGVRPDGRDSLLRQTASQLPAGLPVLEDAMRDEDRGVREAAAEALRYHWRQRALDTYRQIYRRHLKEEMKQKGMYWRNETESVVSLEAAEGIERILKARGELNPKAQAELKDVREKIRHFNALPQMITPVIFGLNGEWTLDALVDDRQTVLFDLDGTAAGARWTWVRPRTAILVWDPRHTGRVTSGRQLFGSVTWWVFWDDGYQALRALDDDGDGALTDEELAGLAVWRDRNGNGVSDEGEVDTVTNVGIVSIAVEAVTNGDGVLFSPAGVRLEDGEEIPTFDWVSTPVRDGTSSQRGG